mmetsp:Transcript_30576/g.57604  ORF Transcript_30576/g.57604 Transcript_30576/m.57604 type:complete len:294 (+) Transcript_30576:587-1468(+)
MHSGRPDGLAGKTHSVDPAAVAQRSLQRLPNHDGRVLNRVVIVNVRVSHSVDVHADPARRRHVLQLRIQEGDGGGALALAQTVQRDGDVNGGLARSAVNSGGALRGPGKGTRRRDATVHRVHSLAHGARKGFEGGLDDVVGVAVARRSEAVNAHAEPGFCHQVAVEGLHQARLVAADARGGDVCVELQSGLAVQVYAHSLQALVQRREELRAHLRVVDPKLREGSAHGGAHSVIDGLRVRVFLAVLHAYRQVQQPVRTELVQHVIQERHVRVVGHGSGAVQPQDHLHLKLGSC